MEVLCVYKVAELSLAASYLDLITCMGLCISAEASYMFCWYQFSALQMLSFTIGCASCFAS